MLIVVVIVMVMVVVVVMVMVVAVVSGGFFLTSLINSRALSNAVIMALPDNVGINGEAQQTLDRFPALR